MQDIAQALQKRRLSDAVWPQQTENIAGMDRQRNFAEDGF
jgi:hypothetical protein